MFFRYNVDNLINGQYQLLPMLGPSLIGTQQVDYNPQIQATFYSCRDVETLEGFRCLSSAISSSVNVELTWCRFHFSCLNDAQPPFENVQDLSCCRPAWSVSVLRNNALDALLKCTAGSSLWDEFDLGSFCPISHFVDLGEVRVGLGWTEFEILTLPHSFPRLRADILQ